MTTTLIETGVPLTDVAKIMKTTVARVEAEANELDVHVGVDWANRPAVSVVEAASLVSGAARRDRDHDLAWREHLAGTEAWETERERRRASAFADAYDASLRAGRGAPAAAAAGHESAREAVAAFERKTPPPEFNGKSTSTRLFTQMTNRVREAVVR